MDYIRLKSNLEGLHIWLNKEKENFKEIVKLKEKKIDKMKNGIDQLAKERQIGFPWLASAYDELFELMEVDYCNYLNTKKRPAPKASDLLKEMSKLRRAAEIDKKQYQYIVEYYESIAPFLLDLKEEIDIPTLQDIEMLGAFSDEEKQDEVTNYLTKEEYRSLPAVERNQIALDRFWSRPKSKWLIGKLYERFVGYLYEEDGYDVEYVGIFKGFEDLGRDLICKQNGKTVVIQCKNWSKFRTIFEKHIFQFFGTVFKYKDDNPKEDVTGAFYSTTVLSPLARRFSKELNIDLVEGHKFDTNYPCIKCNVSKATGEKIYHLPFDQQYDKVKIEKVNGEFYCKTVKEAEELIDILD